MNKKEKFWNRIAKNYDSQINEDDRAAIKIVENTKKYLRKSDVVLDYACATGKFTYEFAFLVKEIHGIDISPDMIAVAKRNAGEHNIEHVHFTQATIFDKRYEMESFNVILAFNILHLLEEPQQAVQRINQLLNPGGFFISATTCMAKDRSFLRIILWSLSKIGILPYLYFFHPFEIEHILTHGGFEIVETETISPSPPNYFIVARKI